MSLLSMLTLGLCHFLVTASDSAEASSSLRGSRNLEALIHVQIQTVFLPPPVPSPSPSPTSTSAYGEAVSAAPSASPTATPFELLSFPHGRPLPLGPCQGNCITDADCDDGLYCFQRGPNEAVPGCWGGTLDNTDTNYCVFSDRPEPAILISPTGEFFRLKLYWQVGYHWQDELFERKWCLKCKNGCVEGNQMYITGCSGYSSYFTFLNDTTDYGDEIMIQVYGTNLCLHRPEGGRDIVLRTCNLKNYHQRFYAANGSSFDGEKFEIGQHSFPNRSLTQQHHPKHGEIVFMQNSTLAEMSETQFWNKL